MLIILFILFVALIIVPTVCFATDSPILFSICTPAIVILIMLTSFNIRISNAGRFLEQHEAISIELIKRAEKAPIGSFEQFQVFYEIMQHNELFDRNMRRYRRSDRFGHLEPINIIWSESD